MLSGEFTEYNFSVFPAVSNMDYSALAALENDGPGSPPSNPASPPTQKSQPSIEGEQSKSLEKPAE